MSDTEERKSMDDVLASIRRIVRAEKDPEAAQEAAPVSEPAEIVRQTSVAVEEAAPLALTPDMRVSEEAAEDSTETASTGAQDVAAELPPVPAPAAALDPETIREMVREVVMQQLGGPEGDALIRGVIRDELVTGDIGANISKNVLRLIRNEVGSALGNKS